MSQGMSYNYDRRNARYKPPRGGFPPDIEQTAQRWTTGIEKHGHDLGDWKPRSKSSPQYGWVSRCVRCDMTFSIEYHASPSRAIESDPKTGAQLTTENPVLDREEWEVNTCDPQPVDVIRGLNVEDADPALLQGPAARVAQSLLKLVSGRGLGSHWTDPHNRSTAEHFAESRDGIPIILHAQFWRQDQRRNYRPKGFHLLPEFEHEREIAFSNHEVLRLLEIEWYDGQRWIKYPLRGVKAQT